MPVQGQPTKPSTLRELHALRDAATNGTRYELVAGELLVTPAPSGAHQTAVLRLGAALDEYARRERIGHAGVTPRDVQLPGEENSIEPDVFVVPDEDRQRFAGTEPVVRLLLAIEVLSPSSARGDRVVKRQLYQRRAVPEHWIVDLEARVVERWRPADDRPEIVTERLVWSPPKANALPPFFLDLPSFFAMVFAEDR